MSALSQPMGPAPEEPAFEIKGTVSSLTVLRLRCVDLERVQADLAARVAPHPQIFLDAPVVLDAGLLPADDAVIAWAELAAMLRRARLVPVGVAGARPEEIERAVAAGLAVMQLGSRLRSVAPEESTPVVAPAPAPAPAPSPSEVAEPAPAPVARVLAPMMVTTPVRGGQVLYAKGTDLIVVSSVNPGAQVISDGTVQVWGPLRGRALAGAQGRKDARIMCLALEAELVSVAGEYLMAEEIPNALRGKPAQVHLDGDRVRISAL